MKEFYCPICESKLEFVEMKPHFVCQCTNCHVNKTGVNPVIAYLEFVGAIPVQFYLEKLGDKLEAIDTSLMHIAYDVRTSKKGEQLCN